MNLPTPGPIPLVGAPCVVYGGSIQAVVKCNCDPQNMPFLLASPQHQVACHRCAYVFQIVAASYDVRSQEPPRVAVAIVGRMEAANEGQRD